MSKTKESLVPPDITAPDPKNLLELVIYPDPFLTKKARAVTAEELRAGVADGWDLSVLVERMKATMYANEGVGLAAPQVRVGLRLFVADPIQAEDRSGFFEIFNPVLEEPKGSMNEEEGCLSIPGVRAKVKRAKALKVSGLNLKGEPVSFDAVDLLSRVVQHETDHLDGILFITKMGMTARLTNRRKLEELEQKYKKR